LLDNGYIPNQKLLINKSFVPSSLRSMHYRGKGKQLNEEELFPTLAERLDKDFSLAKESLPTLNDISVIRAHLIKQLVELMRRDYSRFLNSLYKIDIDEVKVLKVLNSKDKTLIPEKLANLIIERQLQRIKTQNLYREGKLK
jgi:hypothetical protein